MKYHEHERDTRPYTQDTGQGRMDVNGQEWFATDPYPTWFYRKDGRLYTETSRGIRWADEQKEKKHE